MDKSELDVAAHAQIETAVAYLLITVSEAGQGLCVNLNGSPEEGLILSGMARHFVMAVDAVGAQQVLLNQTSAGE